jgi:pilus assembly protein Flp/PilA
MMTHINTFLANLHAFLTEKKEEAGQTLVEYALIIALISLLVVGLALIVGPALSGVFQDIADALSGAGS